MGRHIIQNEPAEIAGVRLSANIALFERFDARQQSAGTGMRILLRRAWFHM